MSAYFECQYPPVPNPGSAIAPSSRLRSRSRKLSTEGATTSPMPEHPGHIPAGSLKEKCEDSPTYGSLRREKRRRRYVQTSVIVPTVERAFPPKRRWSMTMTGESPSMLPTFGLVHFGNRLRTNGG